MTEQNSRPSCDSSACVCRALDRREFLKLAAAGVGVMTAGAPLAIAMAGPLTAEDFEKLVPSDKKLQPEWIKSLYERGRPTTYRGPELAKIGMPIGGICAGQVYLGGDGKLWHWDIFNQHIGTGDGHYARPMKPASPLSQGFAIRVTTAGKSQVRVLEQNGFRDIQFRGEYPIGLVEYRDADCPLTISLEAFSPFIPLNAEDSALPAIVMRFTLKNAGSDKAEVEIGGWLQNAVCLYTATSGPGARRNRILRRDSMSFLECTFEEVKPAVQPAPRPDILFEDFEKETYEGWTVTGTAFGPGPIEKAKMPGYQGDVGSKGKRLVNSHNTRSGEDVGVGDAHVGTLTSRAFRIERDYIAFLIGGGSHKGNTCINLLVDGKVVDSATGENDNRMKLKAFDVRKLAGKTAHLQIVDNEKGGWGNIGVDEIVFTDVPSVTPVPLNERADYGTVGVALLGKSPGDFAAAALPGQAEPSSMFTTPRPDQDQTAASPTDQKLIGSIGRKLQLAAGEDATVTFLVTWHFPNLRIGGLNNIDGRHYGKRFAGAHEVAAYVARSFDSLRAQTKLWHDTWYDSTLPYWFLDRTFLNTSILATSTCYWFGNGRFYGWEGVGCCPGTCGHVWQYAHAVARLFPQFERSLREMVDLALAMDPKTGAIRFRGEFDDFPAADGQAGVVLRAYREHQMSADDAFLRRNWPGIKKALEYLIREDANDDGILEGKQHNTLDTDWYGPVAWLSSLYLAALRAGEEMSIEVGDAAFAELARAIFERGTKRIVELCWNGEYFVHKPDPKQPDAMKSGNGCEIDQVMGQSWAFQVGLGRVIDEEHARGALRAIWRYNFTPDVGPWRSVYKLGRWYAMPGEGGVLMCTWPKGDKADAQGKAPDWAFGYFNECMNGFEYQVAGHMMWEGMVQEGLAITRAVHDRYHASKRNPWNEVECGDHYARSMASYGVFLAICGYEYHGPKGRLAFAPRVSPGDFRAAFTTAQGWGTFQQNRGEDQQVDTVLVSYGSLRLNEVIVQAAEPLAGGKVVALVNGAAAAAAVSQSAPGRVEVRFSSPVVLRAGDSLVIRIEKSR